MQEDDLPDGLLPTSWNKCGNCINPPQCADNEDQITMKYCNPFSCKLECRPRGVYKKNNDGELLNGKNGRGTEVLCPPGYNPNSNHSACIVDSNVVKWDACSKPFQKAQCDEGGVATGRWRGCGVLGKQVQCLHFQLTDEETREMERLKAARERFEKKCKEKKGKVEGDSCMFEDEERHACAGCVVAKSKCSSGYKFKKNEACGFGGCKMICNRLLTETQNNLLQSCKEKNGTLLNVDDTECSFEDEERHACAGCVIGKSKCSSSYKFKRNEACGFGGCKMICNRWLSETQNKTLQSCKKKRGTLLNVDDTECSFKVGGTWYSETENKKRILCKKRGAGYIFKNGACGTRTPTASPTPLCSGCSGCSWRGCSGCSGCKG